MCIRDRYKASDRGNGKYRALIQTKNHDNVKGEYRYQVIVTGKNGVSKVLLKGKMTVGDANDNTDDPYENGKYTITGSSTVTVSQMVSYYQSRTFYPSFYGGSDAATIKKFCQIYLDECKAENIRAEVSFAQAMKETNFLRFGGDVSITQYNFCRDRSSRRRRKGTELFKCPFRDPRTDPAFESVCQL